MLKKTPFPHGPKGEQCVSKRTNCAARQPKGEVGKGGQMEAGVWSALAALMFSKGVGGLRGWDESRQPAVP